MKLIIDIPNYNLDGVQNGSIACGQILKAVKNGTPLPKGHGRLIDADDLIQDIIDDNQLCIFNSESERIVHDEMVNFAVDRLTYCSTVIEADKSEVE